MQACQSSSSWLSQSHPGVCKVRFWSSNTRPVDLWSLEAEPRNLFFFSNISDDCRDLAGSGPGPVLQDWEADEEKMRPLTAGGVKTEPCPYPTTPCACSPIPPFPSSAFDLWPPPQTVHHANAVLWCAHPQCSVSISQHCGSAKTQLRWLTSREEFGAQSFWGFSPWLWAPRFLNLLREEHRGKRIWWHIFFSPQYPGSKGRQRQDVSILHRYFPNDLLSPTKTQLLKFPTIPSISFEPVVQIFLWSRDQDFNTWGYRVHQWFRHNDTV